ncbi:564_t:CDS:2 [Rhizophagus irregularis]|nr:564_t:CDS:2 [Rhizophagus irregularis]
MNNRMNQLISYANDMWNCVKTIFGVIIDEKHKAILIFFNDKSYFDVNRGLGDDNSGGYDTSPSENNNMAGRLVEFDDVMVKVAYHHRSSSIRGATSRVITFH